jgi:hypothetical protein
MCLSADAYFDDATLPHLKDNFRFSDLELEGGDIQRARQSRDAVRMPRCCV